MLILKISKPGMIVSIDGFIHNVRSPFELDITKHNISQIIFSLYQRHIYDFEIISKLLETRKIQTPEKKNIEADQDQTKVISKILDEQTKKIEEMILKIQKSPHDDVGVKEKPKKKKVKNNYSVDVSIPPIKTLENTDHE